MSEVERRKVLLTVLAQGILDDLGLVWSYRKTTVAPVNLASDAHVFLIIQKLTLPMAKVELWFTNSGRLLAYRWDPHDECSRNFELADPNLSDQLADFYRNWLN